MTGEDIKDRSKADIFTKLFAIGQSTWLVPQSIARADQGLGEILVLIGTSPTYHCSHHGARACNDGFCRLCPRHVHSVVA